MASMTWLCVEPERREKCQRVMLALLQGWGGGDRQIIYTPPPPDHSPFFIWGQRWMTLDVLPGAIAQRRPFWYVDNGFYAPAAGRETGYHRITFRGMTPVLLPRPEPRLSVPMRPWRKTGRHILLALPGEWFGRALGMDMREWSAAAAARIQEHTDRPVLIRHKSQRRPIEEDLRGAWALVTHSSNAAVDAIRLGVPAFVEPTSAAAPVANLDLADLERPAMPDRDLWWRSLMNQQFTLEEMADGTAYRLLRAVREQVDGIHLRHVAGV